MLKRFRLAFKQRHQFQLWTIFTGPTSPAGFNRWVIIGDGVALRPSDNMNQPLTVGVDYLFQDLKHRSHGKESIKHHQARFSQYRYQIGGHGCHQGRYTYLGATVENWIRFVLQPTNVGYPFMQVGAKGNTEQFFLPIRPKYRSRPSGDHRCTVLYPSCLTPGVVVLPPASSRPP